MPYAGLALRQNPEGVVVAAVLPGPFDGDGIKSPTVWRGDLIVSIDGQSLDAAGYIALLRKRSPGESVRVVYRRSPHPDPSAAVPRGDPEGEERSVEIVLDDAEKWSGIVGRGLPPGRVIAAASAGEFEALVLAKAEALDLRAGQSGVDALLAHLSSLQATLLGPGTLPTVARALQRPLSLDAVEAQLGAGVRRLASHQSAEESIAAVHQLLLRTLAVPDLQAQPDLAGRLKAARETWGQRAATLLQEIRDEAAADNEQMLEDLKLIRAGPDLVPLPVALLPTVARHAAALEQWAREVSAAPQPIPAELEERVRAAVSGPVLAARLVDGELWVVGGAQDNRYDMSRIAAVFDVGGADEYVYPAQPPGSYQIVIDAAGDDRYESAADFAGPAAALFGVSLLIDREGNDRYLSYHQGAIAAGMFGVAILIDEGGDDRYVNDGAGAGWSQGVGFFGAGLLVDRGGDDDYQAQKLSQGVGGPGALGLLSDTSGNDSYVANGPHFPSVYGQPGVFAGMSQGFGYGIRSYAPGGIGALYDFAGDDRYSVGEFGQGSGYFQGLGILHDAAGQDWYTGSRYAQGAAAHQAAGILIDESGNDWYEGLGSACQAGAWDESVAMLIDRSGDDTYAAFRLAQGSAAHQSVAVLIDLAGRDRYSCEAVCLGLGGENTYHYDEERVFSFSVLIDAGGEADSYSQPRADNELLRTGVTTNEDPASSDCCGVFSDD
jgi:hypothetical protein